MKRGRPKVILLVGLPGSGKSSWAAIERLPVLSSDAMRVTLADNIRDQTIHAKVFAALRYLLRRRIELGRPVTCVDATHLTPKERRPYFKLRGCVLEAVFFDTSLELCKRRNRARGRVVPDKVIERMAARLVPPKKSEGFSRIRVVTPARKGRQKP